MKVRVLLVYYGTKSTFIQRDLNILSKYFDVDEMSIKYVGDIFTLARKIKKADVIFIWFAGKHAGISVLLSKMLKRKSIVVVGGYDVANIKEIKYGLWANGSIIDKLFSKYALKMANKILVVANSLKDKIIKNAHVKRNDIVWIPTGYNSNFWTSTKKMEKSILTVGIIDNYTRIRVKGIDVYINVAKNMPEYTFEIVGLSPKIIQELKNHIPSNVKLHPPMDLYRLREKYRKATVYCQLSVSEGLPNSLCEAMLCECVPVGTNVGDIPLVIDDSGYVVPYGDVEKTVDAIRKALENHKILGPKARERIKKMFPLERRERELVRIIMELTSNLKRKV